MKAWAVLAIGAVLLAIIGFIGCGRGSTTPAKLGLKARDVFDDTDVVALCDAIDRNDCSEITRLIADGVNVNARGKGGITPLLWAFFDNRPERFELLLKHGADPNVCLTEHIGNSNGLLSKGMSVTQLAATSHFEKHFGLVLRNGGDPNLTNPVSGEPLLHSVIFRGVDVGQRVGLLIQSGAGLDVRDRNGVTPCMQAVACFQQYEIALLMLEKGADQSAVNNNGVTLLHMLLRDRRKLPNLTKEKADAHARLLGWLVAHGGSIEEGERYLKSLKDARIRGASGS